MELVAQIIMAGINMEPDVVSNQKRKLFTDYYDEIFDDSTSFEDVKKILDKYFEIWEHYDGQKDEKGKKLRKSVQRDLYTLYIMEKTGIENSEKFQNILDKAFESFMSNSDISKYRRLAYAKFKDAVDNQIAEL